MSERPRDTVLEDFVAAFNAADLNAIRALYTADAVYVSKPGQVLQGTEFFKALVGLLEYRPRIETKIKSTISSGDTALVIHEWIMTIPSKTGGVPSARRGIATDILRLEGDGIWRIAIDNPWGTHS